MRKSRDLAGMQAVLPVVAESCVCTLMPDLGATLGVMSPPDAALASGVASDDARA